MALTLQARKAVTKETFKRYQKAPKKEKTRMLDEFVVLTGYTRHHALWVLRTWEKRRLPKRTRLRPRIYDRKVFEVDIETRDKLVRISAATIDRLLAPERKKYNTKPRLRSESSLLNRIPLKTFSEWDRTKPGHLQVDLVEQSLPLERYMRS